MHRGLRNACFAVHAFASLKHCGAKAAGVFRAVDALATGLPLVIDAQRPVPRSLAALHFALQLESVHLTIYFVQNFQDLRCALPPVHVGAQLPTMRATPLLVGIDENHCVLSQHVQSRWSRRLSVERADVVVGGRCTAFHADGWDKLKACGRKLDNM